jgi:hypothetical protein
MPEILFYYNDDLTTLTLPGQCGVYMVARGRQKLHDKWYLVHRFYITDTESIAIAVLPPFRPIEGHKCMAFPDFQPMRVSEEPV